MERHRKRPSVDRRDAFTVTTTSRLAAAALLPRLADEVAWQHTQVEPQGRVNGCGRPWPCGAFRYCVSVHESLTAPSAAVAIPTTAAGF
jgi:hypothetical protein